MKVAGGTKAPRRALSGIAAMLCSACATPLAVVPGTRLDQVEVRFGRPNAVHVLDGAPVARRLEYDTGRFEQRTYMVDFDADGRALGAVQVLTGAHFGQIRIGTDTMDSIRREFGTPTRMITYGLSGLTSWDYPYREGNIWNSMMSVEFDVEGIVRHLANGPDELMDGAGGGGHHHGGGHGK
jgi:hypothetical protein